MSKRRVESWRERERELKWSDREGDEGEKRGGGVARTVQKGGDEPIE